jgi:hypothetical protein
MDIDSYVLMYRMMAGIAAAGIDVRMCEVGEAIQEVRIYVHIYEL